MTLITMSNSKQHHTSILGQWTFLHLLCIATYIFKRFKASTDTKYLLPYSQKNLCTCHHCSNKGVWRQTRVSHIGNDFIAYGYCTIKIYHNNHDYHVVCLF